MAVLRTVNEWMPFSCDGEAWKDRAEPRRMLWLPDDDELLPLQVVSVCLPFALVKQPDGSHKMIDTRQVRLARLPGAFGRKAFKHLAASGGAKEKRGRWKKGK